MNIEKLKELNPIEQIIEETEPLRGRGRWMRGQKHDSLVVDTHRQTYTWNSRGEWGDVIAWVQKVQRADFKGAVEWLCRRAGLEPPTWSGQDAQARVVHRAKTAALTVAARHWVGRLRASSTALDYARARGWTNETIQTSGLGYVTGAAELRGELALHNIDLKSDVAKAILEAPGDYLVYPHVRGGRVVYFSTRSTEGKQHWNPKTEHVGERQVYYNHEYRPLADLVVIVEGQADAMTLAQWDIAAVALAGTYAAPELLQSLSRHKNIVLGLNDDEAGHTNTAKIATALGPLTRIVKWPHGDANAWLQNEGTAEECQELVNASPTWMIAVAQLAGEVDGLDKEPAMRRAFELIARLDDFNVNLLKVELIKVMGIKVREFNALLKAARGEAQDENDDDNGIVKTYTIPGGYIAEHLLEIIAIPPPDSKDIVVGCAPAWETKFAARFPDGEIKIIDYLDVDGMRYAPYPPDSMLSEGAISLPTGIGPKLPLRDIIKKMTTFIQRYADLDHFFESISCYFTLFTWFYDCFNTTPYLRFLGEAGTGKSRCKDIVGSVCFRGINSNGATTISPLFRTLHKWRGTSILDEMDFDGDASHDMTKLLNVGYSRRQGFIWRAGPKEEDFTPQVFVVYGPKVLATRKKFGDDAVETRSITKAMGGPTARTDIPSELPGDFDEKSAELRNIFLRYRLEHWQPHMEIDSSKMKISVEPRLKQIMNPLLTLVDDPDLVKHIQDFVLEHNRKMIVERGMLLEARVIEAITGIELLDRLMGLEPYLQVGRLANGVNALIDAAQNNKDESNKQVKPTTVGRILNGTLHLSTKRSSKANGANMLEWDVERMAQHRERFGVDDEWLVHVVGILNDADVIHPKGTKQSITAAQIELFLSGGNEAELF